MTDSQPLLTQLKTLAVARFGQNAEQLTVEDDLFETLGIDSLQALDLLTDLEDAFGVEIPDYEIQGISTLLGLSEVIRRRL